MSIRSFAVDLLPAKLHGLGGRAQVQAPPAPGPEVSTFAALADKLGYLSKADFRKVREAYKFADQAHLGQMRASGAPLSRHPGLRARMPAPRSVDSSCRSGEMWGPFPRTASGGCYRRVPFGRSVFTSGARLIQLDAIHSFT